MKKFTKENWLSEVKRLEWEVLHRALNVARLESSGYTLGDDGHANIGNVAYQLESERYHLQWAAEELLRARELTHPERLSKDEEFVSPP